MKEIGDRSRGRFPALLALLALLILLPAVAGCGGDDDDADRQGRGEATAEGDGEAVEPVTLRAVTFLPLDNPNVGPVFPLWAEQVEEKTNGVVTIEHAGGPESIPVEEQLGAVANGIADVNFNVGSFYFNLVPAGQFMLLSPFTPEEERDNGFFEFLEKVHMEAADVKYLGRFLSVNPFYIWTNARVDSLDALRGTRIRSAPAFHHVVQGVSAEPINLVPGDIFTALDRGVVDGFVWPLIGPRETGWIEVTKNVVNAPFYNQNGGIFINPEKWEEFGPELQEQINEATLEFEKEMVARYLEVTGGEREQAEAAGVNFIELPEADNDRFHTMWYERSWEAFGEAVTPELTEEAKQRLLYEEIRNDPTRILQIPCAGTPEEESILGGCGA